MLLAMIYCLPIMASWDFFHIILMYPKEILFDCMLHTIFLLIISCLTVLFLVAEIPNHIGLEEMPTSPRPMGTPASATSCLLTASPHWDSLTSASQFDAGKGLNGNLKKHS